MQTSYDIIEERQRANEMPAPWNPRLINPALLTRSEYKKICNEKNEFHPNSAYDVSLDSLNREYASDKKASYKHIRSFKLKGITFTLMGRTQRNDYCARDTEGNLLRVDGKLVPYTDEEIVRLGMQPEEFTFAIFDEDDKRVAVAQDEWGCVLIRTAREYRGFGLGTIVGKIARTYEPGKTSGGFTNSGSRNFDRLHREFVRDAIKSGLYSKLVRSKEITMERVRAIIASAEIEKRAPKDDINLSSNSPEDWLLYGDSNGTFVLYDRKLAQMIENTQYEYFADRMIKGYVYAMPHESAGITRIKAFGGATPQIRAFMLALAYTVAKIEKLPLWVEKEEFDIPGFTYGEESNAVGYSSKEVTSGKVIDYRAMVDAERKFRARFDTYDEFKNLMHEMAHSKF